jgi:putative tryptophan/tyrosine transport system substrate-binding protein
MRRRDFSTFLGSGAVAWPLAARAQQPVMPVVGFLNGASPDGYAPMVAAFHQGLQESGYVEGQNVAIEYRWAEGHNDRLPAMVADLVHRQVAVIAATSTPAALAAKAATTTVPIVFETGGDPIQLGLVANLNRPGGNITGVTQLNAVVAPKRLELLHELVPAATVLALLVNPANPVTETSSSEMLSAAHTLGVELHILNASSERDFDALFANLIQLRAGGLVIGAGDPFLTSRYEQFGALTARHAVPAIGGGHAFVAAGGVASYGGSIIDSYHLAGVYTGRVLKGEKAADLPAQQATKIELVINLKAAKALGLTVPFSLLGRADEVIE